MCDSDSKLTQKSYSNSWSRFHSIDSIPIPTKNPWFWYQFRIPADIVRGSESHVFTPLGHGKHAFTPQGARWADMSRKYVITEPQRCENILLTWRIPTYNLLLAIEIWSDSESLIPISGLKSLIPIPIPLYFDILDVVGHTSFNAKMDSDI